MLPEHVLQRRKAFPIQDALYTEYHPSQQGARVIRKSHWLAASGLLFVSLILLITVYSLLFSGFTRIQGFLMPTPGSQPLEITVTQTQQGLVQQQITPIAATNPRKQTEVKPGMTEIPHAHLSLQGAREVIIRYYQSINARDYRTAYNLWLNNPLDYSTFAGGYAHTQHDTITFGAVTTQSETVVRITLAIQAKEAVFSGAITQLSLYQGYYLVQYQSDQTWKIVTANFSRI
jgi:hypothetical protein